MKKTILKYAITALVGAGIALLTFWARGLFTAADTGEIYKALSDGFFVSGILIAGWGLLVLASNGGTFDIFSYGLICFLSLFQFKSKTARKSFHDYRQEKRKKNRSFVYMVIVGCFYIAIAAVFSLLFLQIP